MTSVHVNSYRNMHVNKQNGVKTKSAFPLRPRGVSTVSQLFWERKVDWELRPRRVHTEVRVRVRVRNLDVETGYNAQAWKVTSLLHKTARRRLRTVNCSMHPLSLKRKLCFTMAYCFRQKWRKQKAKAKLYSVDYGSESVFGGSKSVFGKSV